MQAKCLHDVGAPVKKFGGNQTEQFFLKKNKFSREW
jgi:hypothetical protein